MTAWQAANVHGTGVRHWAWSEAPEWVRKQATLNGDDISDVTLVPTGMAIDVAEVNSYCTVMMRATPKGLLIFGHHA